MKTPTLLAEDYLDAWSRKDIDAVLSMHTEDSVFASPAFGRYAVGRSDVRDAILAIFALWPDLQFSPIYKYVSDDLIVVESIAKGTQSAVFKIWGLSVHPTGKPVEFAVADVFPLENGLIKRKTTYTDALAYIKAMQQTGARIIQE